MFSSICNHSSKIPPNHILIHKRAFSYKRRVHLDANRDARLFEPTIKKYLCVRVNICQVKLQIDDEDNRKDYAYQKNDIFKILLF